MHARELVFIKQLHTIRVYGPGIFTVLKNVQATENDKSHFIWLVIG